MTQEQLKRANELDDLIAKHNDAAAGLNMRKTRSLDVDNKEEYGFVRLGAYKYPLEVGVPILDRLIKYHEDSEKELQNMFDNLGTESDSLTTQPVGVYW